MFLRLVRRRNVTISRNTRFVRPVTVDAKDISNNEVPNEKALTWVTYFSHLAEPDQITVIDGTLLEADELDALAKLEEGTSDATAITSAARKTLTKKSDSLNWVLGKRTLSLDEIKENFNGKMKGKHMYVLPYYNDWNNTYGLRISDSAYMTLVNIGLQTVAGHEVWKGMERANKDLEIIIHAKDISILPEEDLIPIKVSSKGKASVDERIAEAKKRYEDGKSKDRE